MKWCARCDNCHWVCEEHPDQPWLGARACTCGAAGAACPVCNQSDESTAPDLPEGFQADVESSQQLPRYTGVDMEDPNRPEIEHFGNCPVCGALVDMRDLGQVMAHMHGEQPLDLTGKPKSDEQ
ncbi:hypothetical protein [Bradyrhizobium sp. sGM-13]|uniref:hypothetical protein n=1 Tax=Bradyrhizobium sp. sGM-13 TaxID=2831781 RepID=UPI001BCF317E|nr:hypothetical protein [Bradyrhizobium sp. sGM-13]